MRLPRGRFICITGLSGSGKSSLAFDTLYAEGQRRYVESLSAYARQFLGQMDKPDVDSIEGLSPAISIDQKTTSRNPRSTVGTVTEISDYLRLLYARIGASALPDLRTADLRPVGRADRRPGARAAGGHSLHRATRRSSRGARASSRTCSSDLRGEGLHARRIDGETFLIEDAPALDKKFKHDIEVVVDRLVDEGRPAQAPGRLDRDRDPARRRPRRDLRGRRRSDGSTPRSSRAPSTGCRCPRWRRACSASTRRTAPVRAAPGSARSSRSIPM